jgi:hypothetical protein
MKKITALAAMLAIPAMAAPAGYFQVPGTETTLKLYGQVQLREGYGLNGNGMGAVDGIPSTDPASLKNDSWQQKGQWSGSWRYYMGVTTTTPSAMGDIVTTIRGRFNHKDSATSGQGVNFNLEQGFVKIGGLKVGTDWALFGYGAWEPNTLFGCVSDENGNWTNTRQINYMFSPAKGFELGFGLDAAASDDAKGTSNGTHPGLTAVAAFTQDWGGVTLAVNHQTKKDWAKNATNRSGNGTSFFLSGGWNITANDQLTAMILKGGDGYGSGQDGFYAEGTADYSFYTSTAVNVGYTHTWNDKFSSSVTVGQVSWPKETNYSVTDADGFVHTHGQDFKLTEFVVNTTWQMTKTVSLGVEYQHSQMKAKDVNAFNSNTATPAIADTKTNKLDFFRFKLVANLF